jgi:thiamine-phosphate pyrophosphorylase
MISERPLTCLITEGELTPENFEQRKGDFLQTVEAAASAGISMVQIREKAITAKQLFTLAVECVSAAAGSETKILVNGRADIAKAANADGVHLPEDSIPVEEIRKAFPPPFLIGRSVHSIDAVWIAKNAGADFVMFGAVFDSGEKKGKGVHELTNVCRELDWFPVLAVGGIDGENIQTILDAGAAGYAAIRYLNEIVFEK